MKRLILLRHAKASAKDLERDFERPLARRGLAQMEAMAGYLARHGAEGGLRPDLALVSPAARTRETWALAGLGDVPTRYEPGIYEAETADLLRLVQTVDAGVGTLALVGHNPAFAELAGDLAGGAEGDEVDSFPTGALAVIDFTVGSWSEVGPGLGRLERFVTPASLGVAKDA